MHDSNKIASDKTGGIQVGCVRKATITINQADK
ncbi:hypothetical protein HCH_03509 [Hahella chejuensis KCTC 2396]|uniref:Uncharacterized protein n=1 Tax=Hahella chejuensis (strain KCTC 2396) TaxID=349521 RepID=Q2SGG9_HAHCH|nr:hypothetical protein HCH_03509 [Hahella chejuensis KCTC 2396]